MLFQNKSIIKKILGIKSSPLLKIGCVLTLLILIGSIGSVSNCTVFTASVGDTVLFGNNEDVGDKNATVWFIPATEETYGWVYFGFHDYPIQSGHFPMGGINDQGLCFDITSVPPTIKPFPETIEEALQYIEQDSLHFSMVTFNGGVFGGKILETCATVEEAVQFIEQHPQLFYGEFQFLFADRTGDSMVLCPSPEGEMRVVRKEGIYQAITNFNVLNPGLGQYPCQRYENAVWMLKEIESEEDLTVEYFTSILEKTHSGGTTYSTIYDLANGKIYLYNHHDFTWVVVFDVEEELEEEYHFYEVPSILRKRGELPSRALEESPTSPFILLCVIFTSGLLVVAILLWKRRKSKGT